MAPSTPLLLVIGLASLSAFLYMLSTLSSLHNDVDTLVTDMESLSEWQRTAVRQDLQLQQSFKEMNTLVQEVNRQRLTMEEQQESLIETFQKSLEARTHEEPHKKEKDEVQ